ncbi:acyltransferase family protein [Sphingobium bisphenolivorans]|uniref:acyltransferase family protein n=1 Tax=Sphingobium bisphenolivorans TaxID=1335760 RepID=UPI0003A19E99|nr:acyltransferase [Sphingobium bisphenolivorans]
MTRDTHIPALDGMRGFAAVLVLVAHLHALHVPSPLNSHVGDYGVMLFFVLSGFLMGHLYLPRTPDRDAIVRYASARVARIIPLYTAVALISFLLYSLVDRQFPYHVDALQLVRLFTLTSSEAIFWSIGPEFQFYFLFPFLWLAFHLKGPTRRIVFSLIALAILLCYIVSPAMPGFSVFSKLHIFITGIALSLLVNKLPDRLAGAWSIPVTAVGFILLTLLIATPPALAELLYPSTRGDPKHVGYYGDMAKILGCAAVIFSGTIANSFNQRVWGNSVMRWLGACSFSLYLLHMPAFYIANLLRGSLNPPALVHSGVAFGLSFLLAALSHRYCELPANRMLRRRLAEAFSGSGRIGQDGTPGEVGASRSPL